jgi:tetratricopeptide (TPR) repeat protein
MARPSSPWSFSKARYWSSDYLTATGRHDAAIEQARRAQELDPLSVIAKAYLGSRFYYARQYDLALEQLQTTLEMDEKYPATLYWAGQVYLQMEHYEDALAAFEQLGIGKGIGLTYARMGRTEKARELARELEQLSAVRYVAPLDIAKTYMGLGETDTAFKWLEKAFEERDVWLFHLAVDPELDPLRNDTRFSHLLRRIGLPP